MASINGYNLKKVKEFEGHEGEPCYQGEIYLKSKKVGSFKSSYTMGPMNVYFISPEAEKAFKETVKLYITNYPEQFDGAGIQWPESVGWFDDEAFILELLTIKDWEKIAKKEFKKGYVSGVMVFNEEGLAKGEYVENRACAKFFTRPILGEVELPENYRLLRVINSLAAFEITF